MTTKQKTLYHAWKKDEPTITLRPHASAASDSQQASCAGFDMDAGKTWIYPSNNPLRDYQFNIVKEALFKNTMVILPTGLGKTFIASVLMFNLYRWYPNSKVVFLAPTKPLVAQQLDSCFKTTGIPIEHAVQMTGAVSTESRKVNWRLKRVFFLTPQTFSNDLARNICPADTIKCVVFDEAHRATGNYSYCEIIKQLQAFKAEFRVLALTATPGSDPQSVKLVLTNLLISHVELRTEDSDDVKQYSHDREIEKIVVPLDNGINEIKTQFLDVINGYIRYLVNNKAMPFRNPATLTKGVVLKMRELFTKKPPDNISKSVLGLCMTHFGLSISLYHAYELLLNHGIRSFYQYLSGILNGEKSFPQARSELMRNQGFQNLMNHIKDTYIEQNSDSNSSNANPSDGIIRLKNPIAGHPKMARLQSVVMQHFLNHNNDSTGTRVMIFSQYRDSVKEIEDVLKRHHPLIRVMSFVGQQTTSGTSVGISQKQQLKIVKDFREGGYNTLVSTCVGEEGLDIGEVDLIICYDCPSSLIRLIQRMGRTGRLRKGRIVSLLTAGKEEQNYASNEYRKKTVFRAIERGNLFDNLYDNSPRLVPRGVYPECVKKVIEVETNVPAIKKKTAKQKKGSPYLNDEEKAYLREHLQCPVSNAPLFESSKFVTLPETSALTTTTVDDIGETKAQFSLNHWAAWQDMPQQTHLVPHSSRTNFLTKILTSLRLPKTLPDFDFSKLTPAYYFSPKSKQRTMHDFLKGPSNKMIRKRIFNNKNCIGLNDSGSDFEEVSDLQRSHLVSVTSNKSFNIREPPTLDDMTCLQDISVVDLDINCLLGHNEILQRLLNIYSRSFGNETFSVTDLSNIINQNVEKETPEIDDFSDDIMQVDMTEVSHVPVTSLDISNRPADIQPCQEASCKSSLVNANESSKSDMEVDVVAQQNASDNTVWQSLDGSDMSLFNSFVGDSKTDETAKRRMSMSSVQNMALFNKSIVASTPKHEYTKRKSIFNVDNIDSFEFAKPNVSNRENFVTTPSKVQQSNNSGEIIPNKTPKSKLFSLPTKHVSTPSTQTSTHDLTQFGPTQLAEFIVSTPNNQEKDDEYIADDDDALFSWDLNFTQVDKNSNPEQLLSPVQPVESIQTIGNPVKQEKSVSCEGIHGASKNKDLVDDDEVESCSLLPDSAPLKNFSAFSPGLTFDFNKTINKAIVPTEATNEISPDLFDNDDADLDLAFDIAFSQEKEMLPKEAKLVTEIKEEISEDCQTPDLWNETPEDMEGQQDVNPKILAISKNPLNIDSTLNCSELTRPSRFSELTTKFRPQCSQSQANSSILPASQNPASFSVFKKPRLDVVNISNITTSKVGTAKVFEIEDEEEDFVFKAPKKPKGLPSKPVIPQQKSSKLSKKKAKTNYYILEEAEVSDGSQSSDEIEDSQMNALEESFIDDNTCALNNKTDHHAIYLQSIKDRVGQQGKYKLKFCDSTMPRNIYSQPCHENSEHYMEDSFCVGDDEVEYLSSPEEIIQLPTAISKKPKKRKRIVTAELDSSYEDEAAESSEAPNKKFKSAVLGNVCGEMKEETLSFDLEDGTPFQPIIVPCKSEELLPECIDLTSSPENSNLDNEEMMNISFDISWDKQIPSPPKLSIVQKVTPSTSKLSTNFKIQSQVTSASSSTNRIHPTVSVLVSGMPNCNIEVKTSNSDSVMKDPTPSVSLNVKENKASFPNLFNSEMASLKNVKVENKTEQIAKRNSGNTSSNASATVSSNNSVVSTVSGESSGENLQQSVILVSAQHLVRAKSIINALRNQYNIVVMPLPHVDYIVSNRLVVARLYNTDLQSQDGVNKCLAKMKALKEIYEKCCVIVETDDRKPKILKINKQYHHVFALKLWKNSSIRVFYTSSDSETAKLLHTLTSGERKRNFHIDVPVEIEGQTRRRYQFYSKIPKVSPICALNFAHKFPTVQDFLRCTPEDLKKAGFISNSRAFSIHWYLNANAKI